MLRALWILLLAGRAVAADEAPPVARGIQLVRADASWRYQVITAPALAPQIGALAASGLDAIAGRGATIAVLGEDRPPPKVWPLDVDTAVLQSGKLAPAAPADQRITTLYTITKFALDDHHALRVLEIRLQFRDDCAI